MAVTRRSWLAAALTVVAVGALVTAPPAAATTVKTVSMKVLVLGTVPESDATIIGIKTALAARGSPYDYINVRDGYADNEPLPLVAAGGRGNYYAIVKMSSNLAYEARDGFWPSALSDAQWAQIDAYQVEFNVRVLSMHSWPFFDGVTYLPSGATQYAGFLDGALVHDPALAPGARISLMGSYVTPAALVTPASLQNDEAHHFNATAYFYADKSTAHANGVAAAVQTNPDTGAETWHFFFVPTAYFAGQSAALGLGVNWVTKGLYLGKRRLYLSMQVDDVFLSTGEWEPRFAGNDDQSVRDQYRSTAADMALLQESQEWLSTLLPAGSRLRYEWAFNGEGVVLNGGYEHDPLTAQARANVDDFWWLSHTYTHPFLDDYTYEQCLDELEQNWDAARRIWGRHLPDSVGLHEMVNPAITGLFNGDCLRAMRDAGIVTAVGDNSRVELRPADPYHGLLTTAETNGFAGTFIIPRWATNIFFDNSLPELNLAHFNAITPFNWTWEELLAYESTTAARNLLQNRADPYMFHQANARGFAWHGAGWPAERRASLLTVWAKGVVDELNRFNAFPVRSVQQKTMRTELEARMARDACGIDAHLVVEGGIATRIQATSTGACRLAVSGVAGDGAFNPELEQETYGSGDHAERTVYAALDGHNEVVIETGLVFRPTCPKVGGVLCSNNGHCDAATNPPTCVCDTGFSGYNCSVRTYQYAGNLVANAAFEQGTADAATSWGAFGLGYSVAVADAGAADAARARYLTMHNADAAEARGAAQLLTIGQQHATPLRIRGFSRPHHVTGGRDANYALYVDAVFDDGTWQYGLSARFDPAAQGHWHEASLVFSPPKPVTYLWVYCMFRYHGGQADFDDVAVQEVADLVDDSVISEDGRCGSQSPLNAACANGACCSTFGYCGTTEDHCTYQSVDDVVETESQPVNFNPRNCRRCRRRSSGPCKHPSGWCTKLNEKKRQCPAGTVLCDDAPAFSRGIRPWIITTLRTRGLRRRAWSRAIRRRFRRGLARAFRVHDTQVDIAYVGDGMAGDESSSVELVVTANENESGEELAEVVRQAVANGDVDVELANEEVGGVHAEESGEVRVELADDDMTLSSGTGLVIMVAACAVACALGLAVGAVAMRHRMNGRHGGRAGRSTSRIQRLDTDREVWGSPSKGSHMPVSQLSDSAPTPNAGAGARARAGAKSDSDASDFSSAVEGMDRRRVSQRQLVYTGSARARRTSGDSRASSVVLMDEPHLLGTPRSSVVSTEDVRAPVLTV